MKNIIAIVALSLFATSAFAHDYHHSHYPNYPRHYHKYNDYHSNNDTIAWVFGGLVLGTIIANEQNKPPQKITLCSDQIVYDTEGKPYILRTCQETIQ